MGITLRCKKTQDAIDLGGGFLRLRRKVSDLYGEPWASHYRRLIDTPCYEQDDAWFEQFDQVTEAMVRKRRVPVKLVDFCLQSDAEGRIHYGACKLLLKIIGGYDDDLIYGYAGRPDAARFKDFRRLLEQCAEHKCDLVWN